MKRRDFMKVAGGTGIAMAVPSIVLAKSERSGSIEGELEQEVFPEEFQELDYDLEGATLAQDIDW
jgi:hypothetical protein